MEIITTVSEMQKRTTSLKNKKTIGFVPTMGFLHEGHIQLMKKAREENEVVVLSIFVNPLQFGPNEDYNTYPRDFDRDKGIAEKYGVDYIFYPTVEEMYPNDLSIRLTVVKRTNVLCGVSRPGHFEGVVTVLTKLFHIIQPDRVYFGLKDAQQVAVVDGLIKDYHFPIELIPVDTVREEDGLAKSSRNVNLSENERQEAPHLYKALQLGKEIVLKGEKNRTKVIERMNNYLRENTSGKIDYIEIYSFPELQPIEQLEGKMIIALAVQYSKARLIDNIIFEL